MKKLKITKKANKYAQVPAAEIDLHGLTIIEAEEAIVEFINDSKARQFRKVRVITGRGIHSPEGRPILKSAIETWLKHKGYSFREAKINEGGEGALEVSIF